MLKKVFSSSVFLFFLLTFFVVFPKQAKADFTITNPADGNVTEGTPTVSITFNNIAPNAKYTLCAEITNNSIVCSKIGEISSDETGTILLPPVCGNGFNVKIQCGSGDYFHAGQTYGVTLLDKNNSLSAAAVFNVKPYWPKVNVSPTQPKPGDTLDISLTQNIIKPGGNDNNNYVVDLKKTDGSYERQECNAIVDQAGVATHVFAPKDKTGLTAGTYMIQVSERVKEGELFVDHCQTGTVFFGPTKIVVDQTNGSGGGDLTANTYTFETEQPEPSAPPPPCDNIVNGKCLAVTTAIGPIGTDPSKFVTDIFRLLLGISGGVALILIIVSGYRLMASQGNPEQVQGAREMLTSAIVGLLFIIFSFVILQIIGVNILHIPSFGP